MRKQATEAEPDFFEIDINNLDKEWLAQPRLYHKYATQLADAQRDFEMAKSAVDVAKADVDLQIRKRPRKFGLEKITEAGVAAAILNAEGYRDAVETVHKARHRVDVLKATVQTLEHKKRALENLVELHGRDYFSEPRAPKTAMAGAPRRRRLESDDDSE